MRKEEKTLFRDEVLDAKKEGLLGQCLLIPPLRFKYFTGAIVTFVVVVCVFLCSFDYQRKESVKGYVCPDKGVTKIFSFTPGVFERIHVRNGDRVVKDEPLFSVYSDNYIGESGFVLEGLGATLLQERLNLEKKVAKLEEFRKSEKKRLEDKIASSRDELVHLEDQRKLYLESQDMAEKTQNDYKVLVEKKLISQARYLRYHESYLEKKKQLLKIDQQLLQGRSQLSDYQAELAQIDNSVDQRTADVQHQLHEIDQRILRNQADKRQVIKAPRSGVVTGIQVSEGAPSGLKTPLAAIIPEGSTMQAVIYVPSRAIGFIKPGQSVKLRYEAFPFQRFGLYGGEILDIAKSLYAPNELTHDPLGVQEPVYKVVVQLDQQFVFAYGEKYPLESGILLEADIVLDKRTLWEWLLDPLYSLQGRV
ncbi:HlyD family efflux transporter periplasmic adaptor subunit [Porticoccaceae bacterium LTM1]|nr:HlyD family efflux transporter periplasmic adaptor subunit [Porticoccaceae bacterium LTM1]